MKEKSRTLLLGIRQGGYCEGLEAEPPAAEGQWGSGGGGGGGARRARRPPRGKRGVGGQAPPRRKQGGLGGGAPSAGRFLRFFNKNNAFLDIFSLNFCFKTCSTIAKKG